MARIEILAEDGSVEATIVGSEEFAEQVYPGRWRLAEAEPEPPVVQDMRITRLAFLSRFTDTEAISIDLASSGNTPQAAALRRYLNKVNAATYIDLAREDTQTGVRALEALGILAAGRADEILGPPVFDIERYKD